MTPARASLFLVLAAFAAPAARAEEGMWLFNRPPREALKSQHGFELKDEWLDHLQRSCVRFSTGGSGSIVSASGLVMTNHHVGSDVIEQLSTAERDLLAKGFFARSNAEEIPCPDLELNVLWSIEDVTARVEGAVDAKLPLADQAAARRKVLSAIEKESLEATKLKSEVVTLWQGARYHLYRYKRYVDVRLVMAPEKGIAFFGGDPDNFEFPRFDLDVCFFRIWEDGKPLAAEHYLRWSKNGCTDGELVFVAGHPGRTERLDTLAHLEFMRDQQYPLIMRSLWRREVQLSVYASRGAEQRRVSEGDLFSIQNSRKARTGILAGLQDPALIARKAAEESALRAKVDANPEWKAKWGGAWDEVAAAKRAHAEMLVRSAALGGSGFNLGGTLFRTAKDLVRLAAENAKPDGERLREYRDANRASFELGLYSPAPIYPEYEIELLTSGLEQMVELLGGRDPLVVTALDGKSPRARATELVRGSKLADVAERKKLAEGGAAAIAASSDPLVKLVQALDGESRALRQRWEAEVDARERAAYAKIAAAKFADGGENQYPDATFTLRLSYGTVKGQKTGEKFGAPFTDFAGLYARADERGNQYPWELPASWQAAREKLDLATPFNFVSTCDIIGGNSGSPIVNKAGEVVGIVFDGNIESLVGDLVYDGSVNRATSVDSRAILAALQHVYGMEALAAELGGAGS